MTLKNGHIIHVFAVLHVAVALCCRTAGISDEIWLTFLSVLMVTLICIRAKVGLELIVAAIILTNVAGYLLGVYGAKLMALLSSSALLSHSVSTFLTTEIIGWSTALLLKAAARKTQPVQAASIPRPAGKIKNEHIILLVFIIGLIITARLLISELFSSNSGYSLYDVLGLLLSRSWMTVVMLCLLVLSVRLIRKHRWNMAVKTCAAVISCLSVAAIAILYLYIDPPSGNAREFSAFGPIRISTVAVMAALTGFSIIYVIYYALGLKAEIKAEKEKASQAEFQYVRLKQQVNPHFLFNSLNILDCLVLDGKTSSASTYIHKLAGIYRYMLKYDDMATVTLEDEMNFVMMYADLLKVRFDDGFSVNADLPERTLSCRVIPCSVQMLIENAIKHNSIGKEDPLAITIVSDGETLTVSNPVRPKITTGESTKIGLNYLKRQYSDRYGKEVSVTTDNGVFSVTIPLLPCGSDIAGRTGPHAPGTPGGQFHT